MDEILSSIKSSNHWILSFKNLNLTIISTILLPNFLSIHIEKKEKEKRKSFSSCTNRNKRIGERYTVGIVRPVVELSSPSDNEPHGTMRCPRPRRISLIHGF